MIGYLGLARETFDIKFAKKKFIEGKKILHTCTKNTIGINHLITNDYTAKNTIQFFKKKNCDKIIIFQTTFTDAKFILHFAQILKKPICIVAFPEPRTGKRLRLNSICGLNLGMHSLIKNNIVPDFIIHRSNINYTKLFFSKFIKKNNKQNKKTKWKKIHLYNVNFPQKLSIAKKQTIGIIGKRPDGFDTCDYDKVEIKNRLNFSLKNLKLERLFEESKNTANTKIQDTKKKITKYLKGTKKLHQVEFNKSISIYHGLESLKEKHKLDAFAVKCWPEMFADYGCASCGPMAMMNEKNISCACEVDVLGSISCNILNQLNGNPSLLVDIVDIDKDDNSVVFWHCGLAPISMAKKGTAKSGIHSNRKKPLLHDFSLKPGTITIFRVSKAQNRLQFFLLKGKVMDRSNSFSGTSGVIRFGKNSAYKAENMFKGGLEHHVAFTYGNVYDQLVQLGKKMKIPTYTL
jgi:L-arabinose isomerase